MLSSGYRRTLNEISALYTFEPHLRDVYVEGPSDRSLLSWFVAPLKSVKGTIYDIDTIHIPASVLLEAGLNDGKRSRVIFLSKVLSDLRGRTGCRSFCIADKDLESFTGISHKNEALIYTDHTCLEKIFFNLPVFVKFFTIYLLKSEVEAVKWFDELSALLSELFLIRLGMNRLGLTASLPDIGKSTEWSRAGVIFDKQGFVGKICLHGGTMVKPTDVLRAAEGMRASLSPDIRDHIHGHDFLRVLGLLLARVYRLRELSHPELLRRVLLLCPEREQCLEFNMFRAVQSSFSQS